MYSSRKLVNNVYYDNQKNFLLNFLNSLEYLEHHIGMGKVRVPEVRVRAMKDYVRPTSKRV